MSRALNFAIALMTAWSANANSADVVLSLNHLQQETNLCVPTSAAIVLNFYGNSHSPREIKRWTRGLEYDPGVPFNDFTQTFFDDLITGLYNHGIYWRKIVFPNDANGFRNGALELKRQIDQGRPIVIDTSNLYRDGHTLVISGYKNNASVFIAVDPLLKAPGLREFSLSTLAKIWNSAAVGANVRAAIVTQ